MPAPSTQTQHNAAQDANLFPTQTVVGGTAGTADTGGTSVIVRLSGNPTTGALYVEDLSADGGTVVNVASGTINVGTVVVTAGTITPATGFEGGTVSIGTAAVELTFTGVTKSIMVVADHNNGTMIYLGGSGVTQAGSNAITRLGPGEAFSADLNDASAALYAVGGTTGQKLYKAALT